MMDDDENDNDNENDDCGLQSSTVPSGDRDRDGES